LINLAGALWGFKTALNTGEQIMKIQLTLMGALLLNASAVLASDELCFATKDTALFADAGLTQEIRPVFQFDGAQFKPDSRDGAVMFGMAYDHLMQQMLEEGSFARAGDWACETMGADVPSDTIRSYDVTIEACKLELSDTRLTLSAASLGFYESSCDIINETAQDDGARILTLQCYGSGEEWPATAVMKDLDDGGLSLQFDEFGQTYLPCDS
jgi:hypothetical protein